MSVPANSSSPSASAADDLAPLLPAHCVAVRSGLENAAVAILGALVLAACLRDRAVLFRKLYFAFGVRSLMDILLLVPAGYAILNVINVFLQPGGAAVALVVDCQSLLRVLYLFIYLEFTLGLA